MSGQGQQPAYRKLWSRVQVGLLGAVVLFCIVMLVLGGGTLRPVYAVAAIFFGIALAGHVTYLVWLARMERSR